MRVTWKGQVTIPQEIRERFGFLPETEVEFKVEGNSVRLLKASRKAAGGRGAAAVSRLRGTAVALAREVERCPVIINPIIFAEVSVGYERIEELEQALPSSIFRREPLPYEAAFLAGKAFLRYRKRRGARRTPLPDFYIGAHAAVARYRLLTRDAKRYRTCFPTVAVLSPA